MNKELESILLNKTLDNESFIFRARANLKDAPEGSLRVMMKKGSPPQYYWYRQNLKGQYPNGQYIKKRDRIMAEKLAQKDYDKKIMQCCYKQNKLIRDFLEAMERLDAVTSYEHLSETRKELVTPWHETKEELVRNWYRAHSENMNPLPYNEIFYNSARMLLRSRAEVAVSEILLKYNVPFVHEPGLYLCGQKCYPNFAMLNLTTGRTVYLEFFEALTDTAYAKACAKKINDYVLSGLQLGKDFIISFETDAGQIDTEATEKMIEECLGLDSESLYQNAA